MSSRQPISSGNANVSRHDISAQRQTPNAYYSRGDMVRRVLWTMVEPLFQFSPRHLYFWRNWLLKVFGAKIGKAVRIYPSARIFAPWKLVVGDEVSIAWDVRIYNLERVWIGDRCIVSQNSHLCAGNHDFRQAHLPFANRPVFIDSDCWICADAFVGPGVIVGQLAVVGACAVVTKNVPSRAVVAGNPARVVGQR